MNATPILRLHNISKKFRGTEALADVSLEIPEVSIVGLIGPNGAGKSTLLNIINGILPPDGGEIFFNDKSLIGLKPHQIAQLGVARVFQTPTVFRNMTVLENLLALGYLVHENEQSLKRRSVELLQHFSLERLQNEDSGKLAGGQQRLLEIARCLMTDPELLLLDEPTVGVQANTKVVLLDAIKKLRDQGKTVVFVSHDIPSVIGISERIVVLAAGKVIFDGTPEAAQKDERVIQAYLGSR